VSKTAVFSASAFRYSSRKTEAIKISASRGAAVVATKEEKENQRGRRGEINLLRLSSPSNGIGSASPGPKE